MTRESFQPAVKTASLAQARAQFSKAQPHSWVSSTPFEFHKALMSGGVEGWMKS